MRRFVIFSIVAASVAAQQATAGSSDNGIVRENALPGNSSKHWDVNAAGDPTIQGFCDRSSYESGATVNFQVKTRASSWRVDVYRLGWYAGDGARLVGSVRGTASAEPQPPCIEDKATRLVDCGTWRVGARWDVPEDATSGVYLGRLVRDDPPDADGPPNWRADNSPSTGDKQHAIPGADPHARPTAGPLPPGAKGVHHAYGVAGHGRLDSSFALVEPRASLVYFVVRPRPDDAFDILVQTSDTTYHAYNGYGGYTTYGSPSRFCRTLFRIERAVVHSYGPDPHSCAVLCKFMTGFHYPFEHYGPDSTGASGKMMNVTAITGGIADASHVAVRALKRSLNTPLITRQYRPVNMPLNSEYPLIRFLERNGYSVAYFTGVDAAQAHGLALLKAAKVYISVGHDEYVSGAQRRNVEAARDAGTHLMFLSSNEFYWKIRFEDDFRTLVCYKETQATTKIDPHPTWTGTWRDARAINPEGPHPENSLTGQLFTVNAQRNDPLVVPARFAHHRFWRHTRIAAMAADTASKNDDNDDGSEPQLVLKQGLLGHEWDEDLDNGFRPPGLQHLSKTTVHNVQMIMDHGSVFDSGTATHHLTLYRHASGALVFGAGTAQWSWGLDDFHDSSAGGTEPWRANQYNIRVGRDLTGPDRDVQQATVNMLADMSVQPGPTLQDDLVRATRATDKEAPTSMVTGHNYNNETGEVTARGFAEDHGEGGVIAGVEVSWDGGKRWHPAHDTFKPCPDRRIVCWTFSWGLGPLDKLFDVTPGGGIKTRDQTELGLTSPATAFISRAVDDSGNLEATKRVATVVAPSMGPNPAVPLLLSDEAGRRGRRGEQEEEPAAPRLLTGKEKLQHDEL